MPEVHAILSASSSKRWLNCTPSARLEQNFPNESSVYAEEGTAAHALGEYKLRKYLHERVRRPTSEFDNEEMDANTDIYAEFIITTVEKIKETCPHPLVMVEERLDYSYLVPQGFGTGDCVIIADGTLYVMDYKNGKGVFVSCDHNPQMMLYAIGAYHAYGYLYNITKVSMTIIQPRLENISTFAIKSAMAELGPNEVTNRTKIEPLAQQKLAESLNQKYGEGAVFINKVVINNMDFEEAYNTAIQQKSIAQQNADKQKIENEAAIAKAEADKQVAITNAEAEAQKTSIAADAQAEANRKIAESLSDTLIEYQKIQKWDGKLPTVSGSNALVSIDPAE